MKLGCVKNIRPDTTKFHAFFVFFTDLTQQNEQKMKEKLFEKDKT
jgi:hypothetical protein